MLVEKKFRFSTLVYYISNYAGWPFFLLLAFDVVVAIAYVQFGYTDIALPNLPLSLFGSAIGVLIGFRNTCAYARWWEARQLLGSVVNDSRTLVRQIKSFLGERNLELVRKLTNLQIAYVHALRLQLRGQEVVTSLARYVDTDEQKELSTDRNPALKIQVMISKKLSAAKKADDLSELALMNIDDSLTRLMNSQGGLERIKNTPMPQQYDYFLRFFVSIYTLILPFGMVDKLGMLTPIGSSVLGLIFLTLDKMGRETESPFENLKTDLPLTSIATTIETNLLQIINEEKLPEPIRSADGVLW